LRAGENGAGKSTLLDALLFCFAAPASLLGVSSLSDLRNTASHEVGLPARSPPSALPTAQARPRR
jgi:predicted ATP-dependent endonuclease of OLD family